MTLTYQAVASLMVPPPLARHPLPLGALFVSGFLAHAAQVFATLAGLHVGKEQRLTRATAGVRGGRAAFQCMGGARWHRGYAPRQGPGVWRGAVVRQLQELILHALGEQQADRRPGPE
jgi:hypothetical protein